MQTSLHDRKQISGCMETGRRHKGEITKGAQEALKGDRYIHYFDLVIVSEVCTEVKA